MSKPTKVEPGQVWKLKYPHVKQDYIVIEEDDDRWKLFCLELSIFGWQSEKCMLQSSIWEFVG